MNPAIQCIILLACTAICASATIKRCHCIKTSNNVKHTRIVDAVVYNPRPHCNRKEVIVTLENRSTWCLIPDKPFTIAILKWIQQKKAAADKMNNTSPKTTTVSATASETVASTSS